MFLGRATEMIKKGGINIAPAEVEDILMRIPRVALAGVVGAPDVDPGRMIAAFVVPKPGQALTEADSRLRIAACLRLPLQGPGCDSRFRDALPVTGTGKLMRRDLKAMAAAR